MSVMDPPSPAGRRWWSVVRARYREEIGAPSSRGMLHEPAPPSLALAKQRAENRLVLDPATGETFARSRRAAKLADFEALGTGAYTYISLLHRLRAYFALLALLSVSSMVSNAYGDELADKQTSLQSWLFTGTSLGNADQVAPAYGATEFLISCIMTAYLFFMAAALRRDARRVEHKHVTPADFTVQVSGLPRHLIAAPIKRALEAALELRGPHVAITVPLHQRELILVHREIRLISERREAYSTDIHGLQAALQRNGRLSPRAATRLEQLRKALAKVSALREEKLDKAAKLAATYGAEGPTSAGVAFITFANAADAISLVKQGLMKLPEIRPEPFLCGRAAEPSDIIWENLGSTDGMARQIRGTIYMSLLSLAGAAIIGFTAYVQPKVLEAQHNHAADTFINLFGTTILISGYLVVFIVVPIVEVSLMRHISVTQKEVSQVLKLVVFQVMATISTIGSFVADTALSLNRDWYILGGFMLVNGMMVDLFMITCIVQGWGLIRNVGRIFYAPKALTQLEMDALYAGDGADMYVVDRLQIVTKFAVMCYICSAAIPLLHWVVLLVIVVSIAIDETNLLHRLHPAPRTDESCVKVVLTFVMPLAVLLHLCMARVFFAQLRDAEKLPDLTAAEAFVKSLPNVSMWGDLIGFRTEADAGLDFVSWSMWVNLPFVLLFIYREWRPLWPGGTGVATPQSGPTNTNIDGTQRGTRAPQIKTRGRQKQRTSPGDGLSNLPRHLVHAAAGSFNGLFTSFHNEALDLKYTDLEDHYRASRREAELQYDPPDTSSLLEELQRRRDGHKGGHSGDEGDRL